ncbi:unnamed protein product [Tetraodon nigroviridis]|uniref:Chromosome 3 SCAF14978, whole genome shotgun sequence n=1 Tax=Tetraodon nigroviridis TaxID=99883 RepID=Q4RY39_TETNG|nr:unnamed protein product [Tetraodon nigroviridis]
MDSSLGVDLCRRQRSALDNMAELAYTCLTLTVCSQLESSAVPADAWLSSYALTDKAALFIPRTTCVSPQFGRDPYDYPRPASREPGPHGDPPAPSAARQQRPLLRQDVPPPSTTGFRGRQYQEPAGRPPEGSRQAGPGRYASPDRYGYSDDGQSDPRRKKPMIGKNVRNKKSSPGHQSDSGQSSRKLSLKKSLDLDTGPDSAPTGITAKDKEHFTSFADTLGFNWALKKLRFLLNLDSVKARRRQPNQPQISGWI